MAKVFQSDDEEESGAVQMGASRPAKGLFPYNQPEVDIYGGLGKPASDPANQPGPRGILGVKQTPLAAGAVPMQAIPTQAAPTQTAQPTGKSPMQLHQEKLAAAQASQQAYAAVPKRGGYSEANTQAYLAALDKSNAMQPSYYSQETPNGAQNRSRADQDANAALANIDSGAARTPVAAGAMPPQQAQQAAATQQQSAQAGYRGKGYSDPRDPNSSAGIMDSELKNEFSNASVLARNPGGAVRKITDANGKVTGYSGGNVTGEVSMVDANGAPLRGNTRGISSIDTSAGYAANLKQRAQDKFGLYSQGVNMDNQQKSQMLQIQKAMFDPKAMPEQRAEATKQYMALNGKSQETLKPFAVTGGQTVIDGQAVTQPSMVFDPTTKQFINPNQGGAQAKAPHAQDIARLKANPKEAAMFEQIYGQGSAQQFLGK